MSGGTGSDGPRLLAALFRRLFPGTLGAEACEDLAREHARERARHGAAVAWLWYVGHLLAPSTWALALALRRRGRARRGRADVASARVADRRGGGPGVSWLDVKLGLRMLVKYPGLTLVGGLAMSVSIAIAVGCFAFIQDTFLRPTVPLPEGERVVSLGLRNDATRRMESRLLHDFAVWREELRSIHDVGAWRPVSKNLVAPDGRAEPVLVAEMTASGFRVARVPPLLGRPLLDADEAEGAPPVVVIGHDVWRTRFDGARDVVGRTLQLGRTVHAIVGVMPEGFAFPLANELWIPLRWDPDDHALLEGAGGAFAFGRLAPGATPASARAEVAGIMDRRARAFPDTHEHLRALVMHYTDAHTGMGDTGPGGTIVARAVLALLTLILLVPFANVAILVYARTATRAGEIAMRTALGASRRRVVTQLFVEALVLAGVAAAGGLTLALYALDHAQSLLTLGSGGGAPFWARNGQDPATVLYALGLTVLAAVVAGIVPGLRATGPGVQSSLSRLAGGNGLRLGGTWTTLIVAQVAMAVALIPRAASLGWQAVGMRVAAPAFETGGLLFAELEGTPPARPGAGGGDAAASRTRVEEVVHRLHDEAGVSAVAYASALPGFTLQTGAAVEIEGVPAPTDARGHPVTTVTVSEGFFEVLGVPIVAGRAFDGRDLESGVAPAIVTRSFVRRVLGGVNPVGRRIRFVRGGESSTGPDAWHEIVGVVGELVEFPLLPAAALEDRSVTMDLDGLLAPQVLAPYMPGDRPSRVRLLVRPGSPPADFVPRLRRIALDVDPALRVERAVPLADLEHPLGSFLRTIALALALVVLSILLLSSAGIYALMSFNVTQRRREIGIRSALGAQPRRVLAGVFARAAGQLGAGVAVGLAAAVLLEWVMVDRLGVGATPGSVLLPLAVSALMVVVGLLAAVGPARRGLRIEPTEALRAA